MRPYIERAQIGRYEYPTLPGNGSNNVADFTTNLTPKITKIGSWCKSRAARKTSKSPPKITLKTSFLGVKRAKNEQKKSPARKPGRV
jgi:hypothetical protein